MAKVKENESITGFNRYTDNVNVLLVDDHPLYRDGLKVALNKVAYVKKLYEAANGQEALSVLENEKIDIVFLDIQMPEIDGIETLKKIREKNKDLKVIALSNFCSETYIQEMTAKGVNGYVLKNTDAMELRRAMENIMEGGEYYAAEIRDTLVKIAIRKNRDQVNPKSQSGVEISPREKEVLVMLCEQYSTAEIGAILFISEHTVKVHRRSLLDKTDSKNLAGLVTYAISIGLYNLK